ncbi:MAG: carboxyl transferase domain-containing protein [Pseudomonadales bacterium]|jgi:acetyl/propionyl-CoA carboxylase alpha subunit/acetyl-CoA carboxylase carboxyltransferase component|nr:carboxyl transferase domain-containing protein [Pseudomonadales bacterium]
MAIERVLVANRGEIAVRLVRACADAGIESVAIYSMDDAEARHVRLADHARALPAAGARAYLDIEAVIEAARDARADAVHPGYGFLSENADFARACEAAGLIFIGPTPSMLELFGDKVRARALARDCGVPLLEGTDGPTDLDAARAFMEAHDGAPVMLKAVAGGGGRGMRAVHDVEELASAFERCASEAEASFGSGALYVERYLPIARHVEVQIVGDGRGGVTHLHERECTLQRRHQKLVEMAPSPRLDPALRRRILDAALAMARSADYRSLGTFEFLVDGSAGETAPDTTFAFMEANPRLQVEHTVTEMVTGVDLVRSQFHIAAGATLADLDLHETPPPARGIAIQLRVNTEQMRPDGMALPKGGTLTAFEAPTGPGMRTDTHGYQGYTPSPAFDSLLAKVISHEPSADYPRAVARAARALAEFRIEGVPTNRDFLRALLAHPEVVADRVHTRFVEEHAAALIEAAKALPATGPQLPQTSGDTRAGSRVDTSDPLAVLALGRRQDTAAATPAQAPSPDGAVAVAAPMQGTILAFDVGPGDAVSTGQQLLVMEAMKMEHVISAPNAGVVHGLAVDAGETVLEGAALLWLEPSSADDSTEVQAEEIDLDATRPDLDEVLERHDIGLDHRRPQAVERRRKTGQRTARENLDDLVDAGSFVEYGPLVIAAQRRRRPVAELIERTPADGMIAGIGTVNGKDFPEARSQCAIMSYDYTVLAGTQGTMNHIKKDRLIEIAERARLPVVFFTEGGGGRPGDTDGTGVAGLDCLAFWYFGRLSGHVPMVGIVSGRCFAGNAALLGTCDVIIATENSNIGMGGPAMIEGGGLGVFRPEEVGPMAAQRANGVVDIAVKDEEEAVAVARQYLSYFQGTVGEWDCVDQRTLRHLIPENRLRVYEIRRVLEALADTGTVLELRKDWGHGMITALARIEGRPVGIMANNPAHLGGALDVEACDKGARFMQLCDAFNLPIVSLCDTPGFMVGPAIEEAGMVRHAGRMFVAAGGLTVPLMTIVLRKGYGLGAQAMAGGSFRAPLFTIGWPTSEFGGMGLEGAVKLGYRKELEAIEDPEERLKTYQEMVDRMYERGKGVNMASHFEIDDVIDPADTRRWITRGLAATNLPHWRDAPPKRPQVDTF